MRCIAGTALLLFAMHFCVMPVTPASAQDITRSCFPGFCVESREAFTAFNRQPARGMYILKVSRTQTNIYLQIGPAPEFPSCGAMCRIEETGGEKHAFNLRTNHRMGRLVGPVTPCNGGEPYFVHLFAYSPEVDPGSVSIVRECE